MNCDGLVVVLGESLFWEVVQRASAAAGSDMNRKCVAVAFEISRLSKDDAREFAVLFDSMMDRAYSYGLWGAAYVIHGGCGDDAFTDFRASLISRGKEAFERAIRDPDSLADEECDDAIWFYEGYQYAVSKAVKSVVGEGRRRFAPGRPAGIAWEVHSLPALFPKLSAKFADRFTSG